MQNLVKNVFMIIGALVATLLLFQLFLGDIGRELIWQGIEPAFQTTWSYHTMEDGELVSQTLTDTFNSVVDISN